jgi:tetratricopeptide (TPR) repeat protein
MFSGSLFFSVVNASLLTFLKLLKFPTLYPDWILVVRKSFISREQITILYFPYIESRRRLTESQTLVNQGLALDNLYKSDKAIKAYDKAIEINPQNSKAWNNKKAALNK